MGHQKIPNIASIPYDIVIAGAGVVGNATARELSRYRLKVAVLEKGADVGMGASSRNSGVIHSGIHYTPGSIRAAVSVAGNALMPELCRDLKVKMRSIGKLTVARDEIDVKTLYRLKEQGEANGVPGLEILDAGQMQKIQPNVGGIKSLYSPSTGIVSPYGLTIALAENALANGVDYSLETEIVAVSKTKDIFEIETSRGKTFHTKVFVNSAGLYADRICKMLGIDEYMIYPCKGEYLILDKKLGDGLSVLVYPAPRSGGAGLGIHLTRTVDGNIMIGPSNQYVDAPDDYACSIDMMDQLKKEGHELLPAISPSDFIRCFTGLRAKQMPPSVGGFSDFVIERRTDVPGFINLLGIESPGLTASPAIALKVRDMVAALLPLKPRASFLSERPAMLGYFNERSSEEKADLIADYPDYREIVCRCEQITRKEILDAIDNPLGVHTLAGIKYRSRAMMGRCQGSHCRPKIIQILENDYGFTPEDYHLSSVRPPLLGLQD